MADAAFAPVAAAEGAAAGARAAEPLRFDGDNSFPDCACCGTCCELNVLAISKAERDAMHACIEREGVQPIDRGRRCCPLRSDEGTCMVWEARPQVCRLHHCQVPRREVLRQNPAIVVPERLALLDLHAEFIEGVNGHVAVRNQMFGLQVIPRHHVAA